MPVPSRLPNPERRWARRAALGAVDASEVARYLGRAVDEPFEVLSGGLANINVRVGEEVVRIHRREPAAAARETALLKLPWRSFRVPAVYRSGLGFLVIELVAHTAVTGTPQHGAAVGSALAEVHGRSFERAGHLDASLHVAEPFHDLVGALVEHARSVLDGRASALAPPLRARSMRALETAAPSLRAAAGSPVLLHGDFKPSNLHWAGDERLLVLDWEFAYSGSRLSDIGQLLRWRPPEAFVAAFADAYRESGGCLVDDWQHHAAVFDLVNLVGLLANLGADRGEASSIRVRDVSARIEETLAMFG